MVFSFSVMTTSDDDVIWIPAVSRVVMNFPTSLIFLRQVMNFAAWSATFLPLPVLVLKR
jgi:hypothetical protein